jgi:hypothetical protein
MVGRKPCIVKLLGRPGQAAKWVKARRFKDGMKDSESQIG